MRIDKLKIAPVAWHGAAATANASASDPAHLLTAAREQMFYGPSAEVGVLPELIINVRWPAPIPLDVLNIDRHNLSGTATVRHQLFEGDTEVYDSGPDVAGIPIPAGEWIPGIHRIGETYGDMLPSRSSTRYLAEFVYADRWQITINDPYNDDGQICINRLPVGFSLALDNNMSWGGTLTIDDSTEHLALGGGGVSTQAGDQFRRLEEQLDWLTAADGNLLLTQLARDKGQLLFVAAYPTPAAAGPPDGGVMELAHQMLAVRDNNISYSRTNSLFGAAPLNFREV